MAVHECIMQPVASLLQMCSVKHTQRQCYQKLMKALCTALSGAAVINLAPSIIRVNVWRCRCLRRLSLLCDYFNVRKIRAHAHYENSRYTFYKWKELMTGCHCWIPVWMFLFLCWKRGRRFLGFRALSDFESPSMWKAVNRCQRRMLLTASLNLAA